MARAGITTERLILMGAELADEVGIERVTLAEVARRFGVKTASLYSHVANTAALDDGISLLALAELAELATEATSGRAQREALAGLANAYRDYALAHPGRFAAMLRPLTPEVAAASAGPRHARLTEAVLAGYGLTPEAHPHAVRLIGSTVRGFITLEAAGGFAHSAPPAAESWRSIIDALDALLRNWPAPDSSHHGHTTSERNHA
ncbi:TetR family transcriptional regulator [Mycetocola tolaasinivorans]|uniref:TetR family transcriptional regulator n=1 Tax=Mycetocola tolaasinivorans TaxID=76635 RepID=A0A3L7ADP7_9MICO|nr:TetR/AcrR family transcriptional regulator [Mycetocola tolaasinivorans]RLP77930.1 TetR family transcriptional regulator [Mycetocola tolaasinivorans]